MTKTAIDLAREVVGKHCALMALDARPVSHAEWYPAMLAYWQSAYDAAPAIAAQLISVQERLDKACELLARLQAETYCDCLVRETDCCASARAAAFLTEQSQ